MNLFFDSLHLWFDIVEVRTTEISGVSAKVFPSASTPSTLLIAGLVALSAVRVPRAVREVIVGRIRRRALWTESQGMYHKGCTIYRKLEDVPQRVHNGPEVLGYTIYLKSQNVPQRVHNIPIPVTADISFSFAAVADKISSINDNWNRGFGYMRYNSYRGICKFMKTLPTIYLQI